ncbi:MAG: glycosyltransferase [Gammaproteobacteria bacterium]
MQNKKPISSVDFSNRTDTVTERPDVDLIVTVYEGHAEVPCCIDSILAFPQKVNFELIVINDGSQDSKINDYLKLLSKEKKITLICNSENQGSVWSANRGMALHPDRDVVLLEGDVEVNGFWLDRIQRCAYSEFSVGTVSPFSNSTAICRYPMQVANGVASSDWKLPELDQLFSTVNARQYLSIPVATNACTYIKRNCIEQTGFFDAVRFHHSEDALVDFSLRSRDAGLKHLLCGDVYVFAGSRKSTGTNGGGSYDENGKVLSRLYPKFAELIKEHIKADPERPMRRRADIMRLVKSQRHKLLFVSHVEGGRADRHMRDLAELLADRFEILILRAIKKDVVRLEWAREGEEFECYFRLPLAYRELVSILQYIGVARVHFHDAVSAPNTIWKLPEDLGVPFDYTLHDYYAICPQQDLVGKDGRYCKEEGESQCNECLKNHPAPWGLDIGSWRAMYKRWVAQADRVLVPSRDAENRMKQYIPEANYVYLPHPEPMEECRSVDTRVSGDELKVIVLGPLSLSGGARLLEGCAMDAAKRNLPLFFTLLGISSVPLKKQPDIPLKELGVYKDSELIRLIKRERADVIFFPTLWPDIYCYALSSAMGTGLPIIAPDFGAFPERLNRYHSAHLLAWESTAEEWNNYILSVSGLRAKLTEESKQEKSSLRLAK